MYGIFFFFFFCTVPQCNGKRLPAKANKDTETGLTRTMKINKVKCVSFLIAYICLKLNTAQNGEELILFRSG